MRIVFLATLISGAVLQAQTHPTTTTLTASQTTVTYGQYVVFQATVKGVKSTPSGTVTFLDSGSNVGSALLTSGIATLNTNSLAAGPHIVTASYGGDAFNDPSTSGTFGVIVNKADVMVTLGVSPNPAAYSVTRNLTAALSVVSPGGGTPTGTVSFYTSEVSSKVEYGTLNVAGQAIGQDTDYLAPGTYHYQAYYFGDANFNSSLSQTVTTSVTKESVLVTVSPSPAKSFYGQAVLFYIGVTSAGGGTPTGTLTEVISGPGGESLTDQMDVPISGVRARVLPAGQWSVMDTYSGDANFLGGSSAPSSFTINKDTPSITLTSSVNPSVPGQPVTFAAAASGTFSSNETFPTGTITFMDGASTLGSTTLSSGKASFTTSGLSAGAHSITAVYGGDSNFTSSTSSALSQTVNSTASATSTTIASSLNPSDFGQSVKFTATVSSSGSGTPSGTVTFKDGTATLGSSNLSGGKATWSTSSLSAGTHSITAVYGGDSNFSGSTSAALSQKVNSASNTGGATSTRLTSSLNPAAAGQSVTFTATVTPNGSGTPTGSVTFEDGNTMLGSGELGNGMASFTTSSLSVGAHSITASYGGDANFSSSTSEMLSESITDGSGGSATYYFPHLAFGGGWDITLTYVNYGPQAATCQTTFYSDAGRALNVPFSDGTVSTRTDTLAAGADIHVRTQPDGNSSLLTGWAEAQCSAPVKASLLYRLITNGVAQGEAGVNAMTALATEFVSFAQTATGVAYANPSAEPASVTLTVLDVNGNQLGAKTITLQPNQHGDANIGPLLGLGSFTGSVQIVSTQPIAVLFLNAEAYPVFSSLPPADLPAETALAGASAVISGSTPTTFYFAHLAFGGGWQTTLTYVNYGPQSTTCQTTFYSDAGDPLNVPFADEANSTRSDNLAGGAEVHLQTQSAEGGALITGWAKAQCSAPVKASLLYRLIDNGVAKGEAGVNAMTAPATEFVSFAQTATGVAYANPSAEAANVTFTVLDVNGNELGRKTITLQPNEHGSANIGPMLGLGSFTGSVQIVSTQPIVAVLLNAEAYPVFSSLPPADLPAGTALAGQQQ